jgi:DNA-binding response OmpR family regulator
MSSPSVLLVEDDPDVGQELSQALTGHGYAAVWMTTGTAALDQSSWPDLVLLDLGLPAVDGITVCRQLRALAPGAVIVVLTAAATSWTWWWRWTPAPTTT